jgi:hypothetical protein
MALAVNANPVSFSSHDGKKVRVKGLVGGVGGDIIEGFVVSIKVGFV